ncbi:TPA: hypothetical protein ACF1JQ_001334 [Streptococcus pyogenes]|uniref:hypothetical protein n=1 Tax=Streptococcus TaxID=1301 RepID=UPI000DA3E110|nr:MULTISPECIES: hypothetical protein [Streptococcus]HEM6116639.1 hypothetical protein [Streptococcus suis]HEN2802402.1 hypothetical protein [Streptococcus agalactiae]HER4512582.1 hypothetical protein [Streptococcus pyogenes NGAS729]HER4517716.1 hypothetical protein [Streptococcus pyogenes NGAS732]NSX77182.1 hypothetical protein [Streptococcus pyogenes]
MYNEDKLEVVKQVFKNNGINIVDGEGKEVIDIDSLSFLSLLIDLENTLGIELEDNEKLFELDHREFTFSKFLEYLSPYLI